jgi:hypothetical protein
MTGRGWNTSVGATGIAIYAGALEAGFLVYPHFWTSTRMGDAVPWYFIGHTFIDGICAFVGLVVVLVLGALSSRRWGAAIWGSLFPAGIFLSSPVGQGINVLLHTNSIWSQTRATSRWASFDEYLWSSNIACVASLVIVFIVIARVRYLWRSGAG